MNATVMMFEAPIQCMTPSFYWSSKPWRLQLNNTFVRKSPPKQTWGFPKELTLPLLRVIKIKQNTQCSKHKYKKLVQPFKNSFKAI
jgi:hypothetical protein